MIPLPITLAIAGLLALFTAFGTGYLKGVSSEKENFIRFQEQMKAVDEAQQRDFEKRVKAQQEITNEAAKKYVEGVATIRADYQRRLRDSGASAGSGEVPAVSQATGDVDAGTGNDVPAATGTKTCENLAEDAAITTYQLLELQNWVRDQSAQ